MDSGGWHPHVHRIFEHHKSISSNSRIAQAFKQIASPSFTAIVLETHMKIAVICPSINRGSRRKGVGIIAGFPFPQPTPPYDIKPILNSQLWWWWWGGCGALLLINKAGITQPAGYWEAVKESDQGSDVVCYLLTV